MKSVQSAWQNNVWAEAEKLGFEECVVPYVSLEECKKGSRIRVIGVSSVQDAVDKVFG